MKPNSASVEREKSGQGTGTALQGEIRGLIKRSVDVSEMTTEPLGDQSTANGLHNPPPSKCFPLCFQEDGLQHWS